MTDIQQASKILVTGSILSGRSPTTTKRLPEIISKWLTNATRNQASRFEIMALS
jgi:hypothetical protein